jgi:hypothetical protein
VPRHGPRRHRGPPAASGAAQKRGSQRPRRVTHAIPRSRAR